MKKENEINELEKKTSEKETCVYLEREIVKVNGKEYSNYFVRGHFIVRGNDVEKKIKMDIPRGDVTMYDVLDMVFENRTKVELFKIAKVNRDMTTGKRTTSYRYEVVNESGDLRARVVPSGDSNSSLLDKVYKDFQKDAIVEEEDVSDTNS